MEKGIPLVELPELDENNKDKGIFDFQAVNPRWPLGIGAICIMGGLGTSLALMLSGKPEHNDIWPFGMIAVFVGVGLFLHYFLTQTKDA